MEKYGRWTLLSTNGRRWLCRCDCGTERWVMRADVIAGRTKSCGCGRKTHGMEKSPEYRIWTDMKRRCYQPHRPDFARYGGRGITVCSEWMEFANFYSDMGPRPKGYTLDRSDNDGPYCKDNCHWIPRRAQERNKSTNHVVEIDGRKMTLVEAAERYGLNYATVCNRIHVLGWSIERALKERVAIRHRSRLVRA
jgi:hypothetical protein